MNKKVGIYIILSAVLLYLYYKRGDLAIFAAFVAVVAGTLIFRDQNQTDDREGFGFGGGGGDKACAKMGFTKIKLDKDDLAGSLEKVYKTIKKVADKHWPYFDEDAGASKKDEIRAFIDVVKKTSEEKLDKDDKKKFDDFVGLSSELYRKNRMDAIFSQKPENIKNYISGGEITLKLLEKLSKSDEIDSGFKKNFKYLNCLCKYWISIYKEVQKANDGGDEEEKPKKKKKASDADEEEKPKKKKKASEDDEGGGGDEEEKPKKKKKASEDDDE
jgi:hypothetical protein